MSIPTPIRNNYPISIKRYNGNTARDELYA